MSGVRFWFGLVLPEFNVGIKESRKHSECSASHPCLWRPAIVGMDGVEEMDAGQPVFVLLLNETLIGDMGRRRRRRRAGRRRMGSKRGCEATGLK